MMSVAISKQFLFLEAGFRIINHLFGQHFLHFRECNWSIVVFDFVSEFF